MKNLKYICLILFSLFLIACTSSSDPDPNPTIYISPGSTNLTVNESGDLSIKIKDFTVPIFGISIQVEYNNAKLSFNDSTGMSKGDLFNSDAISFVQSNGNTVHLSLTKTKGANAVSGNGDICVLSFTANAQGDVQLTMPKENLHFYNSSGEEIKIDKLVVESAALKVQ